MTFQVRSIDTFWKHTINAEINYLLTVHLLDNNIFSRKNPYQPHGRSWEIPSGRGRGRGGLKATFLEEPYENNLEFPRERGAQNKKTSHVGSMDIFWNCTIEKKEVDQNDIIIVRPFKKKCVQLSYCPSREFLLTVYNSLLFSFCPS